jgi:hypothetical protein
MSHQGWSRAKWLPVFVVAALLTACRPPDLWCEAECGSGASVLGYTPVAIRDGRVIVQGTALQVPPTVEDLGRILGPPSELKHEHQRERDVYGWQAAGIVAHTGQESRTVRLIGLVLAPGCNSRGWCRCGIAVVTVEGTRLRRYARPSTLRSVGFAFVGSVGVWDLQMPPLHLAYPNEKAGDPAEIRIEWSR